MNDSEDRWIIHDRKSCGQFTEAIHEPNLLQMQGMEGEAVVYYCETRHNAAYAVKVALP